MHPIQLVTMVLNGIATLALNPALGGGGIGAKRTSELLTMLSTLISGGESTWAELKQFAEEIKLLVAQNGEPTRGQWDAMVQRDLAARALLEENRERIEQEIAAETEEATPEPPPSDPPQP